MRKRGQGSWSGGVRPECRGFEGQRHSRTPGSIAFWLCDLGRVADPLRPPALPLRWGGDGAFSWRLLRVRSEARQGSGAAPGRGAERAPCRPLEVTVLGRPPHAGCARSLTCSGCRQQQLAPRPGMGGQREGARGDATCLPATSSFGLGKGRAHGRRVRESASALHVGHPGGVALTSWPLTGQPRVTSDIAGN